MTLEQIVEAIKSHPKFNTLHWIQRQRVIVAASWTKHAIKCLSIHRGQTLKIAKAHKTHKDFKGILFDIINAA